MEKAAEQGSARAGAEALRLAALLRREISAATGAPSAELADDATFASFGLESLQAVTIAANLSEALGREIPATLFFDYPTIRQWSEFLASGPGAAVPAARSATHGREPIAIVGTALRFPGASSPAEFWENLNAGRDAITEVSPARWNWRDHADVPALRWGGFLADISSFDHELFQIPEPEAARMDPQQKILLECVHEAIESAHLTPALLSGSRTGVFVGVSSSDHSVRQARAGAAANVFDATGNAHSIAANRISYLYHLRGPSFSLDTACSSSLVAFHEACRALQAGDCDLAIVAGVNVILEPAITRAFAEAGMLSPDGRCKTFDAKADGYVRGEGVGVVLLRRQSDADPGHVIALARGSAINHDGKTNGLTAPSGPAQEEVIRDALAAANLAPADITFVEAHGTGTALGDPVEFLTLARVFGNRGSAPLRVGSAKAFVGHLEAAAGICGLIKAALSLKHRALPAQLHFAAINPKMASALKEISVLAAPETFAAEAGPLRAGISSFGFGGTNAHVILESAPAPGGVAAPPPQEGSLRMLAFSATDAAGLRTAASAWVKALSSENADELVTRSPAERLSYSQRFVAWGESVNALREELVAWQKGESTQSLEIRLPKGFRPRVAFGFTGQGSQYPGMGAELGAGFQSRWREVLGHLDAHFPESLLAVCRADSEERAALLYRTDYGQALLFSLELSLARTLEEDFGVEPALGFGHSLGELSAAAFAGAITTSDACRMVAARGILMQELTSEGAMLSVRGPRPLVEKIAASTKGLEFAAVNGPDLFTLTGPGSAVEEGAARLRENGLNPKPLAVTRAFHSALMEPMLAPFARVLERVSFREPRFPLLSSLTGKLVAPGEYTSAYWLKQAREATQFEAMIQAAAEAGANTFLEVGPHPVISVMGPACAPPGNFRWLPTLTRGKPRAWLRSLAELTALGARRYPKYSARAQLPFTPFSQRKPGAIPMADTQNLVEEFRILVAGLLQVDRSEVDPDTNLVDLGADSLLLLNAIQTIKDRHGVSIGVAEVFRDLNNLRAIAAYVAERKAPAPAPALAQAAVPPAASAAARPAAEELNRIAYVNREAAASPVGSDLRAIISHQLALMNQQLALLASEGPVISTPGLALPAEMKAAAASPLPALKPAPAPGAAAGNAVSASAAGPAPEARGVLGSWRAQANREVSAEERARNGYVEKLIQRFNARTGRTKEHTQKYRRYLADNRVSAGFRPNLKEMIYTIVFHSGQGAHFKDIDGNDYIDFTMGFGVNLFGHQPDFIERRVRAQLDQGYCVGPQAELAGIVAEKACRVLKAERIAFLNSGTEAVMTAIRLARAVTKRNRVVIFEGSYHGHADVVLARSGEGGRSYPVAPGVPTGLTGDVTVLPYGESSALDFIRAHGNELAAVIVEPVQSRYPEHQPVEFLKEIRKLTEQSGTAFIFDEVICGLRVAPAGAQELFGIKPDLSAYGKVLGGGMPIGAVAGKARFLDPIDGGHWNFGDDSYPGAEMTFFAGTFCKHPVTMAAAEAVLDRFLEEGESLTRNLNERTAKLVARINAELAGLEMQCHNFGSLFRFKSQGNIDLFFANLNLRGAYVWEGRNLFLSTAHTAQDEDEFVRIVREAVAELKPEGFLRKKG